MKKTNNSPELWIVFGALLLLGVVLIPVPSTVLDALLVGSFVLAILTLLTVLGVRRPMEFSVFPTLLLIATAYRLSANIATTRSILTDAPTDGTAAAGEVIQAFGRFVAGNEPIVGLVIFLLLTIVNFIVITKGANRVSEVSARFTLDALPGKQMAIDADAASGAIEESEAKRRREALSEESGFFGAMDGSMKFVRGDAVAGILITMINVAGGLVLGVVKHGMSIGEAMETFTVLTIGDGLVSQVPALMVSISAGLLVTRSDATARMGAQLRSQIGRREVLHTASVFLAGLAVLALTQSVWLGVELGAAALLLFWLAPSREGTGPDGTEEVKNEEGVLVPAETLELAVGGGYVRRLEEIGPAVENLRRELAGELGVVLPAVRVRDDLSLKPGEFAVRLRGTRIGGDRLPGGQNRFEMMLERLRTMLTAHAHEIFGHEELTRTLEGARRACPGLLQEAEKKAGRAGLLSVYRGLLAEGVPVRDTPAILEAVSSSAAEDSEGRVEAARRALARTICERARSEDGAIHAVELVGEFEEAFQNGGRHAAEKALRENLVGTFVNGDKVLVTSAEVRPKVRRITERFDPGIIVLSREELARGVPVDIQARFSG